MGQVVYEDPIDHISGKIAKKFRTIYKYAKQTGLKYTSVRGERTTAVTQAEIDRQNRFKAVAAAVLERKADLTKVATDLAAFKAQKDSADGKKTMKAYLWKVCGEEYDAQHQG